LRRQNFAGEIPKSFAVDAGSGSRRVDEVLPESRARPGKRHRLRRETRPDQVWRAVGKSVTLNGLALFLVAARNEATAEVKYFLANGTRSVRRVSRVGFRRWTVEHLFRVAKQEVGLMDYEGRKYRDLMRHLILCNVVLGFVSFQADRLRRENPRVDVGASEPGAEPALRGIAGSAPGRVGSPSGGPGHSVSSSPKRNREEVAQKAAA